MRPLFAVAILLVASAIPCSASFDLATERAAARASGLPLTPAEFHRVRPPASQDAAPLYAKLNALLKRKPLNTAAVDAIPSTTWNSGSFSPRQKQAIRHLVDSRADVSALVHQIAALPTAYFPHTWTLDETFWYISPMRLSAKWLRCETVALANQGRLLDAVRTQSLALRIANQSACDPTSISYLVSQTCEKFALSGLELVAHNPHCNQAVRNAISSGLGRYNPSRDLKQAFRGATLLGVTGIQSIHNVNDLSLLSGGDTRGTSASRLSKRPASPVFIATIRDPNEATYLHWMSKYARAAHTPGNLRAKALAQVDKDFEAVTKDPENTDLWSFIALSAYANDASWDNDLAERREALLKATSQ